MDEEKITEEILETESEITGEPVVIELEPEEPETDDAEPETAPEAPAEAAGPAAEIVEETAPEEESEAAADSLAEDPAPEEETAVTEASEEASSEDPQEDTEVSESEADEDDSAETDGAEQEEAAKPKPKKKAKKKQPLSKKSSTIILLLELALLVVCVSVFMRSVSLNKDDDKVYTDPQQVDSITCSDGRLHVNNVSTDILKGDNVSYNISYTWGPEDTDYPSVPRSVTATYKSEEDKPLYDISLYRESFTPASKIPDGKTIDNWFDGWESADNDISTHQPMDSGDLHGFLITSNENLKNEESGSIYTSSSFYFAVQDDDGVSVYVLEGILYDPEALVEYESVLLVSRESITIKQAEPDEQAEQAEE